MTTPAELEAKFEKHTAALVAYIGRAREIASRSLEGPDVIEFAHPFREVVDLLDDALRKTSEAAAKRIIAG